ncbi:hypothetical protein [Microbacterium sp.]|uniref:hypothetical protein n=1 Tax=Microbacterium sp. TaxID=51671 RepID=UPI00261968F9|nr:hypothetical protein [Microbacterium sp.]
MLFAQMHDRLIDFVLHRRVIGRGRRVCEFVTPEHTPLDPADDHPRAVIPAWKTDDVLTAARRVECENRDLGRGSKLFQEGGQQQHAREGYRHVHRVRGSNLVPDRESAARCDGRCAFLDQPARGLNERRFEGRSTADDLGYPHSGVPLLDGRKA